MLGDAVYCDGGGQFGAAQMRRPFEKSTSHSYSYCIAG